MTQLVCEECEADLNGLAVDFSSGQPVCKACGAIVTGGQRKSIHLKASVAVPASVKVERSPDGAGGTALSVRVPWRIQSPPALTQLTYAGIIGAVAFSCAQSELNIIITVLLVALVSAVLLGVRAINHTTITVAQGRIAIRHAPLPWLSRVINAKTLEQVYVDRRPLAQKKFDYSVRARVKAEPAEILLFRSLADPMVALYLEQSIEQFLHIEDVPVSGEFRAEHMNVVQQHAYAKPSSPAAASHAPPAHPAENPSGQVPSGQVPSGWPPQQ